MDVESLLIIHVCYVMKISIMKLITYRSKSEESKKYSPHNRYRQLIRKFNYAV